MTEIKEQIQVEVKTEKRSIKFMEEMMDEVRIMFFVGAVAMWISLLICKSLDMKEAFTACAAQLGIMFTAIVAKAAWGKE